METLTPVSPFGRVIFKTALVAVPELVTAGSVPLVTFPIVIVALSPFSPLSPRGIDYLMLAL